MTALISAYDRLTDRAYGRARTLIAPEVRNSQYAYAERLRAALAGGGRWLDIGCGHDFLPPWMPASDRQLDLQRWSVTGIDMDAAALARHHGLQHRIIANGERLPFADGSFDLITANMVVEHVAHPDRLFGEVSRVLTHGGRVILHTPNAQGYTTAITRRLPQRTLVPLAQALLRRKEEDVYPTYYRANSADALRAVSARVGLIVEACEFVNSSPQAFRVLPLMVLELLLMRTLRAPRAARYRPCLLVTLRKPGHAGHI